MVLLHLLKLSGVFKISDPTKHIVPLYLDHRTMNVHGIIPSLITILFRKRNALEKDNILIKLLPTIPKEPKMEMIGHGEIRKI